jgi:four helix bundle protein
MGKSEAFEELMVWQKSIILVTAVYQVCQSSSICKDWGLRDQMQRAAVSVPANIAEGYERDSKKELIHFLRIAKGSAGELRYLLRVASSLKYLDQEAADSLIRSISEISRMLRAMANSVAQRISIPKF